MNLTALPYRLDIDDINVIEQSERIREVHPERYASRSKNGIRYRAVIALLLVTDNVACAIVEREDRDGYRVLERDPADTHNAVYNALEEWCEEHGYH